MAVSDLYRVVVQFPYVGIFSGTEQSQNTWYVKWNGPGAPVNADLDSILNTIKAFYHNVSGLTGQYVERYLASRITTDLNAISAIMYKMPNTPGVAGPPIRELDWTRQGPNNTSGLPEEVCVAVSFHGDLTGVPERDGTTRPASRRRGRFFVGPLNVSALGVTESSGHVTVQANLINTLKDRASVVVSSLLGTNWAWQVFSRTGWSSVQVVGGWVDDNFDIQRRRGDSQRNKTLW